jgi:hypothetical protein
VRLPVDVLVSLAHLDCPIGIAHDLDMVAGEPNRSSR